MHNPQSRSLLPLLPFCARLVMLASSLSVVSSSLAAEEPAGKTAKPIVNNAALIPPYKPDSAVTMEGMSPDWVKTLIMAQFRIETASPEGTFASATKTLDHYAETGVNGLWINPVYERDPASKTVGFNGYGNYGPHTIDPSLTGTADIDLSFAAVKTFVNEAHKRNIRVVFDIVVWGVAKGSPVFDEHKDWFSVNGAVTEMWGGWGFNWDHPDLREWFISATVDFIIKTDADGFRVDLAPDITGYSVFEEVRKRLYARGKKVIIISEAPAERRGVYDFEQNGVGREKDPNYQDPNWLSTFSRQSGDYYLRNSISDSIKTGKGIGIVPLQDAGEGGKFRFYSYNLANHDSQATVMNGSRLKFGYPAIFAPFIPMWFIGEEWNNPKKNNVADPAMYFNTIDWAAKDVPANRAFFEDIKRFIQIRRSYPDIFEYFPENHRETNLIKVEVKGNPLESYARYAANRAIIVVPNNTETAKEFDVPVPLSSLGLKVASKHKVTDLISMKVISEAIVADDASFRATVMPDAVGIYLVEPAASL